MTQPIPIYLIGIYLFSALAAPGYGQDDQTERFYYIGAMGNRVAQVDITFDENHIKGTLYYISGGKPVILRGLIRGTHLDASLKTGDHRVIGRMKGTVTKGHTEINGHWKPVKSNTDHLFHFIKVADYMKSSILQSSFITLTALYPYFVAHNRVIRQINAQVQDSVLDRQHRFLQEGQSIYNNTTPKRGWIQNIRYEITYFSSNLISLGGKIGMYTGGAHGMTNPLTHNFFIHQGQVDQLQLDDLFEPGTAYEECLSRLCLRNLYHKGATWIRNGEVSHLALPDLRHFTVSPRGITFYFPPYMVGPYSDGSFTVTIPFDSLNGYLDQNGPLKGLLSIPHSQPSPNQ